MSVNFHATRPTNDTKSGRFRLKALDQARRRGLGEKGNGRNAHTRLSLERLLDLQHVLYDTLPAIAAFARRHGLRYWAQSGTAIGAQCFGSILPWDDDVDFTTASCSALDVAWGAAAPCDESVGVAHYQRWAKSWDCRVDRNCSGSVCEAMVLHRRANKTNATTKYHFKLRRASVAAAAYTPGEDLGGIDLDCLVDGQGPQAKLQRRIGMEAYLTLGNATAAPLEHANFGPTTIPVMPTALREPYFRARKMSCAYGGFRRAPQQRPDAVARGVVGDDP